MHRGDEFLAPSTKYFFGTDQFGRDIFSRIIHGGKVSLFIGFISILISSFIGVISGLVYFFFSKEHTGIIGKVSRIGVYFLMIKFGASFGFAVMGRISLLIGRFEELIEFSKPEYYYSTPIILVMIVITLGYWAFKDNNKTIEE